MLKTKLIMIEGIPGSGKSTTAGKIKECFDSMNIPSRLYLESDCANPTDYAWISVIAKEEYHRFIAGYPEYEQVIKRYMEEDNEHFLVYYQKMKNNSGEQFPEEMMDYLSGHEPYDGKVSDEEFCRLHLKRYRQFAQKAKDHDEINIFESSYLQNQVNELLLFHITGINRIIDHLASLAQIYEALNPVLVYLTQPDVYETILRAANERRSPDKNLYPDWIDHVIRYISNSAYGRENNVHDFKGAVEYFKKRKEVELKAVKSLGIRTVIIESDHYDAEKGIMKVTEALSKLME